MGDVVELERDCEYPALEGVDSALVGFCAAFNGNQDCRFIADTVTNATCVDYDAEALAAMRPLYPIDWTFVCADVYEYAASARAAGVTFDLVSLDPYTNEFQRCADHVQMWCELAERMVVLGIGRNTHLDVPDGWRLARLVRRSHYRGGVFWAVLQPC